MFWGSATHLVEVLFKILISESFPVQIFFGVRINYLVPQSSQCHVRTLKKQIQKTCWLAMKKIQKQVKLMSLFSPGPSRPKAD